jgi:hypothetical protein
MPPELVDAAGQLGDVAFELSAHHDVLARLRARAPTVPAVTATPR